MTEAFAFLMGAALIGAALFYRAESASWRSERAELLNRIMAKNYTDFVYTTATEAPAVTAIAPEAPDAAWHEQNMKDHPEQYPDGIEAYE